MTIYYHHNQKIIADRYDTLPKTSEPIEQPEKIEINNIDTHSDIESLESSQEFGSDLYLTHNLRFKPIFKLYHKFYR